MKQNVAFLFAGQGSQYVGMGKDLYESFPESRAVFDKADKVLGFSISSLCFNGPQEELTKTHNCQPVVLTVSVAAWEAFKHIAYRISHIGDYAAGLSLGEYSALVAAEAISFEDAVSLVRRRGEFMEEAALRSTGKMLSLIGLDLASVEKICAQTKTEIANVNCPGQTVISGGAKEVDQAAVLAKTAGAKMAVPLEVSGAFHSSLMKDASIKLAGELDKIQINLPRMTVVSNVTAGPVKSASKIKENLVKQVASSVLWEGSMRFILSQGVSKFYEFGPGKVLKGLMRRIDSNAQLTSIEKKEDIEHLRDSFL